MSEQVKTRKKLIEVALPLEAINIASAREKSIRHGHPSTLHLWWARRPLAAARAVIFSQMVDDPSSYSDELLANAESRTAATEDLERRRELWRGRKTLYEKAGQKEQTTIPAPGPEPTLEECAADLERERLFVIIRQLVLWENTANEIVLAAARGEIWRSWRRTCADNRDHPRAKELFDPDKLPAFHDPFAGGGALPLEAQRLGLEAHASDLNPVSVLINKAMIEIPSIFVDRPPVNPESLQQREMEHKQWHGAQGLAEDVRYYGKWMRDEAEKRIGHLYPKVEITEEIAKDRPDLKGLIGRKLRVIAWLWARTVKSPNPAFAEVDVPLITTFMLASKPGKEASIEPVIEKDGYSFSVRLGKPEDLERAKSGTKLSRGANFRCVMSGTPIGGDYIKSEAMAGRMGARLMVTVAEGERGRVYLAPSRQMETVALQAKPEWKPDVEISGTTQYLGIKSYGMERFSQLFTDRQIVAMTTLCDLVRETRELVERDAIAAARLMNDRNPSYPELSTKPYADAVAVYLALSASKAADNNSTLCQWMPGIKYEVVAHTFARNALPMSWDYAESNPFAESSGDFYQQVKRALTVFEISFVRSNSGGYATQADAQFGTNIDGRVVSTDPPYYDNIPYADLSDFFYIWLRRSLKTIIPELFATVAVPKAEELVAFSHRHKGKDGAEAFFLKGMTNAMGRLEEQSHPAFPVTIYYAFKQSEGSGEEGISSTGWETFLDAVIRAGFALTGTWPMRTERDVRSRGIDSNALASSIILVCRPRAAGAPMATRREFINTLRSELPIALSHLQRGNIAPVDLAQAAIGPGMGVFTRYAKVIDAEGKPITVRDALALINQTLDEVLAEQEGDFDADTRWALAWFEHVAFDAGDFGLAETLSKAKNTSVQGMKDAGIIDKKSPAGKVRLLRPSELPQDWDPVRDPRLTVWEVVHHLVRRLESGGESAAGELVSVLGGVAEVARELAYRLYTICERTKRAQEALSYNALVQSWPEISRLAREGRVEQATQEQMFR